MKSRTSIPSSVFRISATLEREVTLNISSRSFRVSVSSRMRASVSAVKTPAFGRAMTRTMLLAENVSEISW